MGVIERIERGELELRVVNMNEESYEYLRLDDEAGPELLRLAKLGSAMQWVPVSERLPKKEEIVLVLVETTSVRACVGNTPYGQAWYLVDKHCYLNMYNVTHWMPLPPLPELKEDNK